MNFIVCISCILKSDLEKDDKCVDECRFDFKKVYCIWSVPEKSVSHLLRKMTDLERNWRCKFFNMCSRMCGRNIMNILPSGLV